MIILWVVLALLLLCLLACYICYRMAFYVDRRPGNEPAIVPEDEIYKPFAEVMLKWAMRLKELPAEHHYITSHDNLRLHARFYEFAPGAPIEIMFHGYRGSAERDLSGGVQRSFALGRSVLLIDQRCSGESQGHVISFGVNEHKDCIRWAEYAAEKFGPDRKFILTGISMGASTVLMAADRELPENVVGILADCGFTSAHDIIKKVIKDMGLPPALGYPFVKLAARLFGGFELEECTALEAVKRSRLPVIFYHGESDDFVPCYMSRELYEACTSRKELVTVPGAGHGLSYPVDPQRYLSTLREFYGPELSHPDVR